MRRDLANNRRRIGELRLRQLPQWQPSRPQFLSSPGQKAGRNEQCPCGLGKKYKKYHGAG
ncbi:SEC-C metal-binding domain-containing protein [Rhizobium ruizarguesonis]|uniref:SEC-C metal-binding domain-containing protein n=1 Tax=Rhizobium ruizarguesonis TaxID=2081791 RepID=UPI0018D54B75